MVEFSGYYFLNSLRIAQFLNWQDLQHMGLTNSFMESKLSDHFLGAFCWTYGHIMTIIAVRCLRWNHRNSLSIKDFTVWKMVYPIGHPALHHFGIPRVAQKCMVGMVFTWPIGNIKRSPPAKGNVCCPCFYQPTIKST